MAYERSQAAGKGWLPNVHCGAYPARRRGCPSHIAFLLMDDGQCTRRRGAILASAI